MSVTTDYDRHQLIVIICLKCLTRMIRRPHTAATLIELGLDMFLSDSEDEWGFTLKNGDFPTSVTTYCSFIMTAMTMAFEDDIVDGLVSIVVAVAGDK